MARVYTKTKFKADLCRLYTISKFTLNEFRKLSLEEHLREKITPSHAE